MAVEQQRREVYFSGHVQGVGFRFTAQRVAGRHDVTGFVRNMPDGRVQLVVEGQRVEIGRFLDDLARTMQDHIRKTTIQEDKPTGRFQSFSIRY